MLASHSSGAPLQLELYREACHQPSCHDRCQRETAAPQPKPPIIYSECPVFEPKSETLLRARTADIGPDGCFIDTLNPFAPGTVVKARIEKGGSSFETTAKVVYSLTSMGMGLAFQAVAPEQLWVLHEWLGGAGKVLTPEISVAVAAEEFSRESFLTTDRKKDVHSEALSQLIAELMDQGLLSEEKGNAILQTLSHCPEK